MKILVTGVSGQLGSELADLCARKGHETFGTYLTHNIGGNNNFKMDLSNRTDVLSLFEKIKPHCVVHCAAASGVEFCEERKKEAWMSNVMATRNVAEACLKSNAKVIFISSEYVFPGREGGLYTEEDVPDPVNFYGKTKLAGECIALCLPGSLVARTSVIYSSRPGNYADSVLKRLQTGNVSAATDMVCSPTFAPELARGILQAIEKDSSGILHMAGATRISRYDFARKIAEAFGYNPSAVLPVTARELGFRAPRPADTSLDVSKAKKAGIHFSPIDDAVRKLRETANETAK